MNELSIPTAKNLSSDSVSSQLNKLNSPYLTTTLSCKQLVIRPLPWDLADLPHQAMLFCLNCKRLQMIFSLPDYCNLLLPHSTNGYLDFLFHQAGILQQNSSTAPRVPASLHTLSWSCFKACPSLPFLLLSAPSISLFILSHCPTKAWVPFISPLPSLLHI